MVGINQQALLIICGYFGKLSFSLIKTLCALQGPCLLIQNLGEQIIWLIFFRMLLDDLLQHLNRFTALIRQNESGREFFTSVSVVWLHVDFEKNGRVKLPQLRPEGCVVAMNFRRTLQNVARFFFVSRRQLDLAKTLISLYVSWIQCDRPVSVIDGLICFLKVLRINKRELAIRLGIVRVCLNCVF